MKKRLFTIINHRYTIYICTDRNEGQYCSGFHPHTETRHENTRCCSGQRLKVAGCNGKQKTGKTMPDKCPTKFVIFTKKAATNECELRLEGPSGYYIA